MEKKEKVKSTRYVDGEAVDAVDDEVMPHTHTYTHTHTHTYIPSLSCQYLLFTYPTDTNMPYQLSLSYHYFV